tara:strand:- start:3625 stop:3861 length:237 start_codon:yes stop_codon:yes gene_type:complete
MPASELYTNTLGIGTIDFKKMVAFSSFFQGICFTNLETSLDVSFGVDFFQNAFQIDRESIQRGAKEFGMDEAWSIERA